MKKKNRKNNKAGIITVGGNFALPGQKKPNVIVLTQPCLLYTSPSPRDM